MAPTPKPSFTSAEECDLYIAIYAALGKTQREIGELLVPPLSQQGVARRISIHAVYHARIIAFMKTVFHAAVTQARDSWEIKQSNRDKGHRVVGKLLDQALEPAKKVIVGDQVIDIPVEPSAVHLKAAEMGIERVEGKALDRKAVLQLNADADGDRREVDGGKLDEILDEMRTLKAMHAPTPLLEAVPEAELANESDPDAN